MDKVSRTARVKRTVPNIKITGILQVNKKHKHSDDQIGEEHPFNPSDQTSDSGRHQNMKRHLWGKPLIYYDFGLFY